MQYRNSDNSSDNPKTQTIEYWRSYAKHKKKLIVFNGQDVLDLTQFAQVHPAGQKAITSYIFQDVKNILFRIYPHPSSTLITLRKFCCGKLKDYKNAQNTQFKGICKQKSSLAQKKQLQNKKVSFDTKKQKAASPNTKIIQRNNRKVNSLQSKKLDQNSDVSQQNKPVLMVPLFNVKFDTFMKNKILNQ